MIDSKQPSLRLYPMKTSPSSSLELTSNDATTGCLSSILHRLLCNNLRNTSSTDGGGGGGSGSGSDIGIGISLEPKAEKKKPATPSIVARLMGLESMPVYPYSPPDLIRRSRSTGSLENWPVFITGQKSRGSPQIKTSLSFREVPTFLRQENEDFLLLSFTNEDDGEIFAMAPKEVKPSMSYEYLKEEKSEEKRHLKKESKVERRSEERKTKRRNEPRNSHKENMADRNQSNVKSSSLKNKKKKNVNRKFCAEMSSDETVSASMHREKPERPKTVKKNLVHSERMGECSPENSSPDSVLGNLSDMDGKNLVSVGSPLSGDDEPKQKNPRRKLSPDLNILTCPSPSIHHTTITRDGGPRALDKERTKPRKTDEASSFRESPEQQTCSVSDIWGHICRLVAEDAKSTNWTSRELRTSSETREIAVKLGLEILDLLLLEAVAACSQSTSTL